MASRLQALWGWFDSRMPTAAEQWRIHASEYYAPKNFNFWYYFGSLAGLVLIVQIVSGIFLTMNYKPDANLAFGSVEYIMRDVPGGWIIRYIHSTGASAFFVVVYLHMFRGLLYGSYHRPRELVWIFGVLIFLSLMAEAFFGYLLPWGQMSYWGAQVIVNLFGAIPWVGDQLAIWIRGDYVVSDATLNRFFAFHVVAVPLVLLALVGAHLLALHEVGSNNPDGCEIKKVKDPKSGIPLDSVPFHPYYTVKDTFGVTVFLVIFFLVVFFWPEGGGYFLEANNFIAADPLKTPPHIAPVWYFTPYYSILRATTDEFVHWVLTPGVIALAALIIWSVRNTVVRATVGAIAVVLLAGFYTLDAKVWGVVLMGVSVMIFFFLPWLDRCPVKSIRYKGPITKAALVIFVIAFFVLGYLGTESVTTGRTIMAQIGTAIYFMFFFLMPWWSKMDKCKPEPRRVT